MICLACAGAREWPLCRLCRLDLREGPQFLFDGRLLVSAAFHHHGAARRLVHRLKYGGLGDAGRLLAAAMASRLPPAVTAFVPVPRAVSRRIRHGIDPAAYLADEMSRLTGIPTVHCLTPALWWPRHAIRAPGERQAVRFRVAHPAPRGAVLVDDVVTTGATLAVAQQALSNLSVAVAATSPGTAQPAGAGKEGGMAHDSTMGSG